MANSPAPINTFGLEVFVHDVIAAINISPSFISKSVSLTFATVGSVFLHTSSKTLIKFFDASVKRTLSWGLFGPEIVGTTVDISKDKVSVKTTSSLAHKFCSFAYFSTIWMFSFDLPENSRYFNVSSSIGKNPQVAPYSGAILAIVALSASVRFFRPSP